ncbi:VpsP family polysaccharide biosynthesis protein [Pseudoalteromonas sp. APC 3355]|uniref:VpsP family polysaccharide biosynthesis protein n=1 Tax=Pseudoalteromonas sp. APC 3355 TaxID=3035199 RepID=UPI0025B5CE4E|nr:VpsP family polysaccharide biosynthesis protein [Pseudoalteromonas sp. APC 3355]MDN3473533.1 VpsP family polysaccharide biosynthesis protein [Pseudoalteromonas sp. APC 3355]
MININTNRLTQITILAVITLVIGYQSLQSMRANTWYFNALNILKQPESTITLKDLKLADRAITYATTQDPSQPHYWQLSAYIKMHNLAVTSGQNKNKLLVYQQAEKDLLKSLELRQTWSETWIALAQVVSYQEGPTERVYEYIQQAKKFGPYKLDVQLGIIQIALMNWQQLPPKYKALYVAELNLAVKYGYKFYQVFDVAKQVDALPILCLSLKFGSHFEPLRTSWMFKKHCN